MKFSEIIMVRLETLIKVIGLWGHKPRILVKRTQALWYWSVRTQTKDEKLIKVTDL